MSQPILSHVAQVEAIVTPTISDLLALIASTTYTHWDVVDTHVDGVTIAVLLKPKLVAIDDVRILFAGHADAQTPVMQTPSTWLASCLLMRVGKGCSLDAIADWLGADPLGAANGTWMGYVRASMTVSALVPTQLRFVETAETFEIEIMNTTDKSWCEAGCRYRNASPSVGYEANGRLVGMAASGSVQSIASQMHANSLFVGQYGVHGDSPFDGYGIVRVFVPGSASVRSPSRIGANLAPQVEALKDTNGGLLLPPVILVGVNVAVEARDLFIGPNMTDGQEVEDDATSEVIGIALSSSGTGDAAEQAYLRRVVP